MAAPELQVEVQVLEDEKTPSYRVICISLYHSDLADIDSRVAKLKAKGLTWMNRSALIRRALAHLDDEILVTERRR